MLIDDADRYREESNKLSTVLAHLEESDTPGAVSDDLRKSGFTVFRLDPLPSQGALARYQLDAPDPGKTAQAFDTFEQNEHPVVRSIETDGKVMRVVFDVFRPSQAKSPAAPVEADLEKEISQELAAPASSLPWSGEKEPLAKLAKDDALMLQREKLLRALQLPDPRELNERKRHVQSVLETARQIERDAPKLPRLPLLFGSAGVFTRAKIALESQGYSGEATLGDGVSPGQVQQALGPKARLGVGAKGLVRFTVGR